jgi:hypothetical protein
MAPFAKVALAIEAIRFSQRLDACSKRLSADRQRKLLASF